MINCGGFSIKKHILNDKIRAKEVRLIDETGKQVGVVPLQTAQGMAQSLGLDLILMSDAADPPVCKILDFGQFKYQQQKKDKLNKKNTKTQVTKEVKMGPKISENDFQIKLNRGREFLKKGQKVKLTLTFRGREVVHTDLGKKLVTRFVELIQDSGISSDWSSPSAKTITVMINPR